MVDGFPFQSLGGLLVCIPHLSKPQAYHGKKTKKENKRRHIQNCLSILFNSYWLFWQTYSESVHRFELVVLLASFIYLLGAALGIMPASEKLSIWQELFLTYSDINDFESLY